MDIMTLAAANAYTDKKVVEGERPLVIDLNLIGLTIGTAFSNTPLPLTEDQVNMFREAAEKQIPLVFISEEVEDGVTYHVRVKAEFHAYGISDAYEMAEWLVVNRHAFPRVDVDFVGATIKAGTLGV